MKTAIITGATSGIGKATAVKLAQNGFNVIITGRRQDKLDSLRHEIESQFNQKVLPLCFDVRKMCEVESALGKLPKEWSKIDVLINNAGLAVGSNHIQDGVVDDWERMIDTNIKGLLYVTKIVSKQMIAQGGGHIVNIGSTAGTQVYENGNVYCASKHAVHALSQSMRIDMVKHGIKVTEVRPGLAETEFSLVRFKGDSESAKKPYMGLIPLSGDDIADVVLFAITRPPHVNLNDIEVTPTAQANSFYIFRK
ncbi:MAG: SDR family NAD(P)-dependent oxidoreductase [Bacteroidales bacterium]|jgi:NADP-dependent 3-hydroxy acid dehydrogenase YdfG|nr:SDR family NAD(P)-dependent oxidoreductase [Bacteroidales bacterium]MDD4385129.1 SDR family NAD(P)-dependent oxidoreductase [Bacteroidales bacterium]MDY0197711.1 SDR family NAD(P)-dependent oxidoreductase [Tenuifilaceae bacterium]